MPGTVKAPFVSPPPGKEIRPISGVQIANPDEIGVSSRRSNNPPRYKVPLPVASQAKVFTLLKNSNVKLQIIWLMIDFGDNYIELY